MSSPWSVVMGVFCLDRRQFFDDARSVGFTNVGVSCRGSIHDVAITRCDLPLGFVALHDSKFLQQLGVINSPISFQRPCFDMVFSSPCSSPAPMLSSTGLYAAGNRRRQSADRWLAVPRAVFFCTARNSKHRITDFKVFTFLVGFCKASLQCG